MARRTKKRLAGEGPTGLRPDWRPLIEFAAEEVPDFMWMFRDVLEDGSVVEAYKHRWTRRYLHLDSSGRAYVLVDGRRYEEVDADGLRAEVLGGQESRPGIVRKNDRVDDRRTGWARSAARHRVPRAQALFAIRHAGACFEGRAVRGDEPRLYLFGDDEDERPLEIVAVEREDGGLLVVHSMPMRARFEARFEEAMRWRR